MGFTKLISMTKIGQPERVTKNRIVQLFKGQMKQGMMQQLLTGKIRLV